MLDVLRVSRSVASKSVSYAIWYPSLARAHVTTARGIHFTSMGHSASRSSSLNSLKVTKRTELLPEEALYLIEKGALLVWKAVEGIEYNEESVDGTMHGSPMTVQQAFSEMIGKEDISLERYQVR
jgi:tRNA-splicing endonuclease subunit Sen54